MLYGLPEVGDGKESAEAHALEPLQRHLTLLSHRDVVTPAMKAMTGFIAARRLEGKASACTTETDGVQIASSSERKSN